MFLSIIIPAYNEENRLPGTLDQVDAFLSQQSYSYELLVVDNNSSDKTAEIIRDYKKRFPYLVALFEAQPGKGAAVRCGMLQASGQYRFMADADLSMPIENISSFLPPELDNLDLAIASREAPGSIRYHEPEVRHLGGRLMNWIIQLLILPGLNDTQCGFKCFSASAAQDLFQHQTLPGWSFDIEILSIARKRGYQIEEIPIPWYYHEESKVHALRDAIRMIRDILVIRRNSTRGVYDPKD